MNSLKNALAVGLLFTSATTAHAGGWAYSNPEYTAQEQSNWCWASVTQFTNNMMGLAPPIEQCELATMRVEWCDGFGDTSTWGGYCEDTPLNTGVDCCNMSTTDDVATCNQPWFAPWQYSDKGLGWGDGFSFSSTTIRGSDITWEDITSRINGDSIQVMNFSWGWNNPDGTPTGDGHLLAIVGWCEDCGARGDNASGNYVKIYDPGAPGSVKWISWEEFIGSESVDYMFHSLRSVSVDIQVGSGGSGSSGK